MMEKDYVLPHCLRNNCYYSNFYLNVYSMRSKVINKVSTWYNTLLATEFHRGFERWVGTLIKDTPNAYDKMIDSNYINTHIGSWKHRLFDGSHTPHEMWDKVKNTFPNDSRIEELQAYFLSMMKDLQTPAGLPFLTVSKEGYDKTSSYLKNQFGIPANWYYDIQTVNLAEIFGTTLGALAVFFQWNKKDKEIFFLLSALDFRILSSVFISNTLSSILFKLPSNIKAASTIKHLILFFELFFERFCFSLF